MALQRVAVQRRDRRATVSLFPFLSVLACVIGTLTLLIAALAVGQVAAELGEEGDRAEPHEVLVAEQRAIEDLEDRIAAARRAGAALPAVRAELRSLGVPPEAREAQRRRAVASRVKNAQLTQRIAALEREQSGLAASLQLSRAELDALERRREPGSITIQPRGSGPALVPFFVECGAGGVRIHKPGQHFSVDLQLDDRADSARFDVFLRGVRGRADSTLIFLIRPDGVTGYERAVERANRLYVRHGKLPLPGLGPLDFGLFPASRENPPATSK
ncbi:MAG: hypothetical protein V3T33_04770 [Myxococcota bacterium]